VDFVDSAFAYPFGCNGAQSTRMVIHDTEVLDRWPLLPFTDRLQVLPSTSLRNGGTVHPIFMSLTLDRDLSLMAFIRFQCPVSCDCKCLCAFTNFVMIYTRVETSYNFFFVSSVWLVWSTYTLQGLLYRIGRK
jgi:hypothetical protein